MAVKLSGLCAGFTSHEDSWYSFLLEAESTQDDSAAGSIRQIKKYSDFNTIRTPDFTACSILWLLDDNSISSNSRLM
jgi:hypothetical protein